MGVKLQLLLGLLLICSTCGSEENSTIFQNASLENVDSTKNFIEKLPKTDTQVNLVNKYTQDFPSNVKYPTGSDTQNNETSSIKDKILDVRDHKPDVKYHMLDQKDSNRSKSNGNDDGKGREDNSRSIDVEHFDPHDFQNNDYGSNNQKLFENSIRKASTKGFIDFSEFEPTTSKTFFEESKQKPKSPEFKLTSPQTFFDRKFEEPKQKHKHKYQLSTPETFFDKFEEAKREFEENAQLLDDHHASDEIDYDDDVDDHIHKLFAESKHKPNSTLDYKEKTKISKNNTVNDDSEYNELRVETTHNINYDSIYNFTSSDEEDTEKPESTSQKEKLETSSPRGFIITTKKSVTLTKPPTSQSNHILSNKIESETIKAINFLTTEFSTTKRLKEENDLVPREQTVEENKIIALQTTVTITTEVPFKSKHEPATTEQIKESNYTTVANLDSATATEQVAQSTVISDIDKTTTTELYADLNTKGYDFVTSFKTVKIEDTTEQTTVTPNDKQTTSDEKLELITKTTTESSTVITTINGVKEMYTTTEIKEPTTEQAEATELTTTTEAITTEQITTESVNRISKAFSFQSTHTTTPVLDTTTETIQIKLSSPSVEVNNTTTDDLTVIMTGISNETTSVLPKTETETFKTETETFKTDIETTKTDIETTKADIETVKTDMETTTKKVVLPKILETTTSVLNTTTEFETTSSKDIPVEFVNVTTKDYDTTLESNRSYHTTLSTSSVLPVIRNISISSEETSEHTTTEDSYESSPGSDIGTFGSNEDSKGKIAAIIISTVGAVCLILLAGLLYIMRKRQKRFNYKQRCRPVGLDDYSVDNVSGYNSTRRKAERQSKRSYGNPAFDDPVAVTHPLNFPALAKFATNTEDIKAEFQEIPQITAKTNELPEGCETKNRYANVIPLPETRVYLHPIDGYSNSDYINANYVTGPKNTKGYYIACQGPMSETVDDFWRMVWEQQTKVILMLTHLFENGVEKCVDYLPPSEVLDCNRLFGDFQVTLKKRDVKEKYIISNLQLKNMVSNSWREITHFWYLGWPEKGIPSEENSIIAFLIEARSYMKAATLDKNAASNGNINGPLKNEINPVVVHCSPGTGRTGVVIACDIAIREFEQTRLVDIPKIVYRIRRDRASAVQTKEQYMFIYKVVSLYATKLTGGALDSF